MKTALCLMVGAFLVAACGGSSTEDGSGGSAGSGASAGASGSGGSGASSGSGGGGVAGSAGVGATAGAAGTAGAGGTAGVGGTGPECTKNEDCKLFDDCCTCAAFGPGEPPPTPCPAACIQSKCSELGFKGKAASCVAGRCIVGFDCDASKVLCKSLLNCPPGQAPTVEGTCWGTCVPASDCLSVKDCATCAAGSQPCVNYDAQTGPTHHCVDAPAGCGDDSTCACLGPSVCLPPFATCSDLSGVKGVNCSCPNC